MNIPSPFLTPDKLTNDPNIPTMSDLWRQLALELARKNLGRPERPEFESIRGPGGLLQSQYMLQSQYDPRAIEAYRESALRAAGTPSTWATIAKQQQLDALTRQQQSALDTARSNLAMHGGLRTGAAERLAAQSLRSGLAARQDIGSKIAMQDEENRLNQLERLHGMELGRAKSLEDVNRYNIENTLRDITQKRLSDLAAYQEQMRAWAAERTAEKTPSGGKK